MDQLQLGKFWLARLDAALPHSSSRIRTRLAWHLAGMSIETDEGRVSSSVGILFREQLRAGLANDGHDFRILAEPNCALVRRVSSKLRNQGVSSRAHGCAILHSNRNTDLNGTLSIRLPQAS
jgi:hypothetical protein